MVSNGIIFFALATLFVAGCTGAVTQTNTESSTELAPEGAMMEKNTVEESNAMMEKDAMEESSMMESGFMGNILAGKDTPYLEFNKADYDKALAEGKTVYLEFYASWCPTCKRDAPNIESYFAAQDDPNVVAFRVNYKDGDTDSDETALAKEYGITYQHTRVVIKDGSQVYKKIGGFNADEVSAALGV